MLNTDRWAFPTRCACCNSLLNKDKARKRYLRFGGSTPDFFRCACGWVFCWLG